MVKHAIKNSLETKSPEIAKEWHPTKNKQVTPEDVTYGARKKVWWRCPKGHEYPATIDSRTSKKQPTDCPFCLVPSYHHIVNVCLPYAKATKEPNNWLQLYILLKMATGLRQTDMLRLTSKNITHEGLLVEAHELINDENARPILFAWENNPSFKSLVLEISNLWPYSEMFFPKHSYFDRHGNQTEKPKAFESAWQRFRQRLIKNGIEPFAERYIRNMVGQMSDSDEDAQNRLGHKSVKTTVQHYRKVVVDTTPLKLLKH